MNNSMSNRMQRFFAFHPAYLAVVALLLLVLDLGVFGQWYLLFILVGMTIFFSISVLVFSTMLQVNRNSGSDDNHPPFTYLSMYGVLYSVVDPRPSRSEQERIERQAEDFKPFVFKDHLEDNGHE
jgi:hypothetical protein